MNGLAIRRTSAFFVLIALLASITVIGAPGALAHHPEVSASSFCEGYEPVITFSAESWTTGARGENATIGIYVDGALQASGSFTAANGYSFDGTIQASAWAGRTVTVMARADAPWGNGAGAGDSRSTTVTVAGEECGGTTTTLPESTTTTVAETTTTTVAETTTTTEPQSTTTTTVGAYQASVSIEVGYCREVEGVSMTPVTVIIEPAGAATVTINSPAGLLVIDETTEVMVGSGRHTWTAEAAPGFSIDGPNRGNFRTANCSTPDGMVSVKLGECIYDVEAGLASTDVRFSIAPANAAQIVVEGPGGPHLIDGSGATLDLAPGDYTWSASAAARIALVGVTSGSFTVSDCSPECTAVIGDYVWLDMNPRNGVQDAGEELVEGVVVHLLDVEGSVLATTVTDGDGRYQFADLCEGTYRVSFELPDIAGLVDEAWTVQGGGDAATDSNADAAGLTDEIVVIDGTVDMSWDAGIVGAMVSPTTVTTLPPATTSTTVVAITTTTTEAETTSTTAAQPASTTTTVPPVTASTLPFTGFEMQATAMIGLLALAGGATLLMGLRRRPVEDGSDSLGGW
ncbi:MAG: SdrD B-like domain-containing protein [Acidimicrobiia bacterium]